MRLQYRLNPRVWPISQRETGAWFCSAQQKSQYHPYCFSLVTGNGRGTHRFPGRRTPLPLRSLLNRFSHQVVPPGQIVILDNLNTHTGDKVRQAIEARRCQLLFLPSYSPDLSPIEEAFSKLKAFLRWVGARTPETLQEALGQALLTITVQDAHGWFGHCGYQPVASNI